jgi:predicted enzyme related to lactoylglutathione lyase
MLRIQAIDVDARDSTALARFWAEALGWQVIDVDEDGEVVLGPPDGSEEEGIVPDLLFLPVPEAKSVKNRLHLDLRPANQAAEVDRLEQLGATRVSVGQESDVSWVVMADPEGNEFCVLESDPTEQ